MKIDVFKVAYTLLFLLGISILITSYDSLDFGLIFIILLFTLMPIAYAIMLFRNKKENMESADMSKKIPEKVKHNVEILVDMGFEVTDVMSTQPIGRFCVTLKSDDFGVRLILDKGQEFVNIAFGENNKWIPISYIRKIIQSAPPSTEYVYNFDIDTQYIKEDYLSIKKLLSDENIANTNKILLRRFNLCFES